MFMKPVIYQGDFYLVEGETGTDLIPGDVINLAPLGVNLGDEIDAYDCSEEGWNNVCLAIRDYTQNREIWSVERRSGFYGRYSAPGYMDATDWHWSDSEEGLLAELNQAYGEEA